MMESRATIIAKASFVLYFFFIFFGTSLPFQESVTDVDEVGSSNKVNQVVFSVLFLTSSFALMKKREELVSIITMEKYLALFLAWCLISLLWSDFSFVSFKRLFQLLTTVTVSSAVLIHTDSSDETLKYFKLILSVYITLSVLSILFIPGAIDPKHFTWRGLAPSKNHLGQASLVSIILWFQIIRSRSSKRKLFSSLMLILSVVLLFGSKSVTAILVFIVLVSVGGLLLIDRIFKPLGIGRAYSMIVLVSLLGLVTFTALLEPELIASIPEYFGKDATFTGRTELWADIFEEARKHLLIGCGFASFWVVENGNLLDLYEQYVWLPNQAHMGYLDILNETGFIGLMLFVLMVLFYFKNLSTFRKPHIWKWFVIATLIINLQETTLFEPNILTGAMFIFSYLALYAEISNRRLTEANLNKIR